MKGGGFVPHPTCLRTAIAHTDYLGERIVKVFPGSASGKLGNDGFCVTIEASPTGTGTEPGSPHNHPVEHGGRFIRFSILHLLQDQARTVSKRPS